MQRRSLITAVLCSGLLAAPAWAQSFPTKALRIVVPFGAGGVADLTARTVAQKMSENLGQPVVIENRPGAGGIVAAELVAKSEPDGHHLVLGFTRQRGEHALNEQLDFAPAGFFAKEAGAHHGGVVENEQVARVE